MILKILLVIAVIATVYFLFIKKKRPNIAKPKKKLKDRDENTLVECTTCGTFVMLEDTFIRNAQYYCSKKCMES